MVPSPKNNNPHISSSFLIIAKLLFMFFSWITSSSYFDIRFMLGGIQVLKTFLCQLQYLLEYWFLGKIKGKNFWNNNISYENSKMGLVGSNCFLRVAINTKNKWTIWYVYWVNSSCYIWCRAEGWNFRYVSAVWWSDNFGNMAYGVLNGSRLLIL